MQPEVGRVGHQAPHLLRHGQADELQRRAVAPDVFTTDGARIVMHNMPLPPGMFLMNWQTDLTAEIALQPASGGARAHTRP